MIPRWVSLLALIVLVLFLMSRRTEMFMTKDATSDVDEGVLDLTAYERLENVKVSNNKIIYV